MSARARWLLTAGMLLFVALLVSQGVPAVLSTLALVGFGIVPVTLFHLLPLLLDALAIRVLFPAPARPGAVRQAVLARWAGESVNSLMPGGQLGGPVLMMRELARCGLPVPDAVAAIIVSTTFQSFAQLLFALAGVATLGAPGSPLWHHAAGWPLLLAGALLAGTVSGFYLAQRRGLFRGLTRSSAWLFRKRDWSSLLTQAEAIDQAVERTHRRRGPIVASFLLSLVGWVVGTVEVYLILQLLHAPVSWSHALALESLGQAIRGAAFAIPGALGVQEGGYLLLAPLFGLAPGVGLALSLAKRARELLLGLPGLLYLHLGARDGRLRATVSAGAGD